jgi:pyridoxine 5-phosphate synthase
MTNLSVNVNKVAVVRNTRHYGIPSPRRIAELCVAAGAHGITVHPRPDERHIRPADVYELAAALKVEFNVEGNPFEARWMKLVRDVRPAQATLVPDSPDQFTSDHGFDLAKDGARLRPVIAELKALGCRVSVFMDPVPSAMAAAKEVGADRVELYTEPYATAFREGRGVDALPAYAASAAAARAAGLGVNAGHDLDLANLGPFLRAVAGVDEVSIGHCITADALEMGFPAAVRAYLAVIAGASAAR